MPLLVCRTCPRYDAHRTGEFGRAVTEALTSAPPADQVDIRHVQCLGGCPRDGVVAVDGPGKARVRFADLTPDDADAIRQATAAHEACPTGAPGDWHIPDSLAGRISSVTFKRTPRA